MKIKSRRFKVPYSLKSLHKFWTVEVVSIEMQRHTRLLTYGLSTQAINSLYLSFCFQVYNPDYISMWNLMNERSDMTGEAGRTWMTDRMTDLLVWDGQVDFVPWYCWMDWVDWVFEWIETDGELIRLTWLTLWCRCRILDGILLLWTVTYFTIGLLTVSETKQIKSNFSIFHVDSWKC